MTPQSAVFLPIADLQRHYARGLSVVDVIAACLDRIAARNDDLRAMIHVDPPRALAAAALAQAEIRAGRPRGPLQGVPVVVKDMIDVAGWPTSCGSRLFEGRIARTSAACVARLEAAGAIVIGKANLHELCAGSHANPWFGKVVNPLDPTRGTGGTSSGAAAAVAAGFCMAAIGTDTGGSNRSPAAATGLWGMKPSPGLIPPAGVQPMAPSLDCVGVLARTLADLRCVTAAICTSPLPPARLPQAPLTIGISAEIPGMAIDPVVQAAVSGWLARTKGRIVTVPFPEHLALEEAGLAILLHEFAQSLGPAIRQQPGLVGADTLGFLARAEAVTKTAYLAAQALTAELRHRMARRLAGIDLFAVPTSPGLAPFLADETTRVGPDPVAWGAAGGACRRWANALGMTAIAMPIAIPGHLPASLQLARPGGEDAALLDLVARAVEDAGAPLPA